MHNFTCYDCGEHDLVVEHTYVLRTGAHFEVWREFGPLDEYHLWTYEHEEVLDNWTDWDELDEDERENWLNWDGHGSAPSEPETVEDSHEFFVRCEKCNREIPFGWSHANRGGRIWPIECRDYDPSLAWLEPRFIKLL